MKYRECSIDFQRWKDLLLSACKLLKENVPLPVEKTKRIIRKCTDEDFDE